MSFAEFVAPEVVHVLVPSDGQQPANVCGISVTVFECTRQRNKRVLGEVLGETSIAAAESQKVPEDSRKVRSVEACKAGGRRQILSP